MSSEPSGLLIFGILFGGILAFIALIGLISYLKANLTAANMGRALRWAWGVVFPAMQALVTDTRERRAVRARPSPIRRADGRFDGSRVVSVAEQSSEVVTASERDVTERNQVPNVTISVTEAAIIATRLAEGMAPSVVAKSLPGYSPRNYSDFMAKVQEVRRVLAQAAPPEPPAQPEREGSQPKLGVI